MRRYRLFEDVREIEGGRVDKLRRHCFLRMVDMEERMVYDVVGKRICFG